MAEITCIRNANIQGEILDILLSNGKIAAIGKNLPYEGVGYDAKGGVAISGFIDCHMHLDKCLLNERAPYIEGTGAEKGAFTRNQKADFTVADITQRAETMILRAIHRGTLAIRTNVDVDAIVELKGIQALLSLKEKYQHQITIQVVAFAQEGVFADGKTQQLLRQALEMGADHVGGHTITCGEGEKHIDYILKLAKEYEVESDFHLDESGNREHYLLPYLCKKVKELGLESRINGIHLCTLAALTGQELELALAMIKDCGLNVTIAPTAISTRALAPVKTLLKNGTAIGLGSDNIRDFFNPLGSGDIQQAALLLSYVQRFFTAEEQAEIWSMLTDNGAKVIGFTGYGITVGNPANITIFCENSPQKVIAYQAQPALIIREGITIR